MGAVGAPTAAAVHGDAPRNIPPVPNVRAGLVALVAASALAASTHGPGRAAAAPASRTPSPQRVTILGDSVMVDGSPGVQAILESTKAVVVSRRAAPGYGLTKSDWRTDFSNALKDTRPTGIAILLGGFDLDYAAAHPLAYAALVGQVMDLLTSQGAQVAWIGELPGSARFEDDAKRRNLDSIVRAVAAGRPAVHYAMPDATFDGPDGQWAMFLPGPKGRSVRIRKVDGQHLCPDGAARLGGLVYETLKAPLRLPPPGRAWQSGSWRNDAVYTASTAYDMRTLKLTSNVCPVR